MSNDAIEQKLIQIVATTLKMEESKIAPDSKFMDDLGADSLDLAELMMAIESEFDCDIPDQEAGAISTVKDAIEYVKKNQSDK